MRLEAFRTELPRAFDGDLAAPHPRDRRFRALLADVPGMATESKLALLSLAAAHLEPGEAYLEVGSFKGLSLIGAMLGNQHAPFYAIENFLEFNLDSGATRDELLGNLDRWVDRERLRLLEGDCFRLLRRARAPAPLPGAGRGRAMAGRPRAGGGRRRLLADGRPRHRALPGRPPRLRAAVRPRRRAGGGPALVERPAGVRLPAAARTGRRPAGVAGRGLAHARLRPRLPAGRAAGVEDPPAPPPPGLGRAQGRADGLPPRSGMW